MTDMFRLEDGGMYDAATSVHIVIAKSLRLHGNGLMDMVGSTVRAAKAVMGRCWKPCCQLYQPLVPLLDILPPQTRCRCGCGIFMKKTESRTKPLRTFLWRCCVKNCAKNCSQNSRPTPPRTLVWLCCAKNSRPTPPQYLLWDTTHHSPTGHNTEAAQLSNDE